MKGNCHRIVCCAASLLAFGVLFTQPTFADTNVLNKSNWVIDGTDDTGTNPVSIATVVKHKLVGSFSELDISYNVGGSGVVSACTIKGNGQIQLTLPPPGAFGGSFYLTSYQDCDVGYVPSMMITQLEVRVGGKNAPLFLRGLITNGYSMSAKDFELKISPPKPKDARLDVSYTLTATREFCVDELNHTNADNFHAMTLASNFISTNQMQNNELRYTKETSHTCVDLVCVSETKAFCNEFVNATN